MRDRSMKCSFFFSSVLLGTLATLPPEARSSQSSTVPTVTYCDLVRTPGNYNENVVRVRAVYYSAFEQSYLRDEVCSPGKPPGTPRRPTLETWVSFHADSKTEGDSEEAKRNRAAMMDRGWMDLTAVGRFRASQGDNRFGHMGCCRFEFLILKVEDVFKLPHEQ